MYALSRDLKTRPLKQKVIYWEAGDRFLRFIFLSVAPQNYT